MNAVSKMGWPVAGVLGVILGAILVSNCERPAPNCEQDCPKAECPPEKECPKAECPVQECPKVECPKCEQKEEIAEDQIPADKPQGQYPVVLVGNIKVTEGKVNEEEARRRVSNKRISLRECYAPVLEKDSNMRGEMDVQFTVSAQTGKIIAAIVRESTLKNKDLEACVTGKLQDLRFDPFEGKEAIVRFNLVMVGVKF